MVLKTRFPTAPVALLSICLGCAGHGGGSAAETRSAKLQRSTQLQLEKVDASVAAQKWDEALAVLDRTAENDLNPYERAFLWVKRADVYSSAKQYGQAADALKCSVELKALPASEQVSTTYRLINLYVGLRRHGDAVALIESAGLPSAGSPSDPNTPDRAFMLAQAYAGAKRESDALPLAKAALSGADAQAEERLQLLCDIEQRLQHYAEARAVAEQLVKSYPKTKGNYLRLAASHEQLGRSDDALRALELAYERGLLSEELELLALVDLARKQGHGARGAAVLERHMLDGKIAKTPENQLRLVHCWLAANDADRAQGALSQLDEDVVPGDDFFELGKLYVRRGEWLKAREPLGLSLGRNVTSPGEAYLLLGIVHYQATDKSAALQALAKAERHRETASCAQQWLTIVGKGRPSSAATCPVEVTAGNKQ